MILAWHASYFCLVLYVTEGDFLNLKSMGHKSMTIMTFGSNKPEQATWKRVEVELAKNGIEIQLISTFTVSMICEPLVWPTIQVAMQHKEHLHGLQLADSCADDSFQPDILIGIDYY